MDQTEMENDLSHYYQTFDAGHWGPGFAWVMYSIFVWLEGVGSCHVLRRRYVEAFAGVVVGFVIWSIHLIEVLAGHCNTMNSDGIWTTDHMCMTRNLAHIGLGVYIFLVGMYDGILQIPFWNKRVGLQAPPSVRQYNFLVPSCFFMVGMVMAGHEQDTMWQMDAHQMSSTLAFLFFFLRAVSYQYPGFNSAAGIVGAIGGLSFSNASIKSYLYWNGHHNLFGIPVPIGNLTLFFSILVLFFSFLGA